MEVPRKSAHEGRIGTKILRPEKYGNPVASAIPALRAESVLTSCYNSECVDGNHSLGPNCCMRGASIALYTSRIPGRIYCDYCDADLGEDAWDSKPWGKHFCNKTHQSNYYHRLKRQRGPDALTHALTERERLRVKLASIEERINLLKVEMFWPAIQRLQPSEEDYRPLRRHIQRSIQGEGIHEDDAANE